MMWHVVFAEPGDYLNRAQTDRATMAIQAARELIGQSVEVRRIIDLMVAASRDQNLTVISKMAGLLDDAPVPSRDSGTSASS